MRAQEVPLGHRPGGLNRSKFPKAKRAEIGRWAASIPSILQPFGCRHPAPGEVGIEVEDWPWLRPMRRVAVGNVISAAFQRLDIRDSDPGVSLPGNRAKRRVVGWNLQNGPFAGQYVSCSGVVPMPRDNRSAAITNAPHDHKQSICLPDQCGRIDIDIRAWLLFRSPNGRSRDFRQQRPRVNRSQY